MISECDVVLINMPFGMLLSPSIGLGLLKAALTRDGLTAKTYNFQIKFAEMIGEQAYTSICHGAHVQHLAGEWVFSQSLFQESQDGDLDRYMNDILCGGAMEFPDGYAYTAENLVKLTEAIKMTRSVIEPFLNECVEAIASCQPKVVGFTSLFHQHVASLSLAKRIKTRIPQAFIVFGGSNCEGVMGYETLRQFSFVDAVVSGEGEEVFPEMVKRVLRSESIPGLEGVFYRGLRVLPEDLGNTSTIQDLDTLPLPDYDEYFEQLNGSSLDMTDKLLLLFETSRGCWWGAKQHCTFCGLNGATMTYRSKSAKRAFDELNHLMEKHPGGTVNVVDNILDMKYFNDLLPLLASRKYELNLLYEVKANLKKDQLRLLREAGITRIQPGIESLSNNVLRIMRKGISALQNIQLLKWCKEINISVFYNLLWGFPGEPVEDYLDMVKLIPLLAHLQPPFGSGKIRLDRFSPNFNQAEQLGFKNLLPYPAYAHVYPFGPKVLSNLAYFFHAEYAIPQNVSSYTKPLENQIKVWREWHPKSELFWFDKGERLLIWDYRPVAKQVLTVLEGQQKFFYMECDRIRTARQIADSWNEVSEVPISQIDVRSALETFTEQELMIKQGDSYLALAYPKKTTSSSAK